MRKLKLQMTMSVDGFVAGPKGELDWFLNEKPGEISPLVRELIDTSDTILMGRKMTPEFIGYWEDVVDNHPESPEFSFAQKMVNTPKIAFSKTMQRIEGRNLRVENGDIVTVINELKNKPGKDLLVYGGATFVSSLIENDLIDEYYFQVFPVAIGQGLNIFPGKKKLKLISSSANENGIVTNKFVNRNK